MAVYKKVPGCETVNISTLEFDTKPTKGSFNPVTSGGVAEAVGQQSSNIAEAFSASSTYAIGEVVIGPDGKLYQCTTAVETAGEWDPEDWRETSLGDILFTLRGSSNIEVRKSHCKVGDAVYADADGNVHFIAGKSVVAADIPADWEFTGVVALREGTKATILYKNDSSTKRWSSMWVFKVEGLKLDGTDSFVLQQGKTSGVGQVEVGTFTASESATDLDTLISELDEWLRAHETVETAYTPYNWHAVKNADADGVDSCFIVVDTIANATQFTPIKSSTSGASAPLYNWTFAKENLDGYFYRKDGVITWACVWNIERFKAYDTNVNSPTDSLTSPGVFNEAGFNATTVVKGHYGTYDNYLENMLPDTERGIFANFKGKDAVVSERISGIKFKDISNTEKTLFPSESWATSLNTIDGNKFFIPSVGTAFKILSVMKNDGSDIVNYARVKAGVAKLDLSYNRWNLGYYSAPAAASTMGNGTYFGSHQMFLAYYNIAVAEIDL